jgi:hypothetical protein
MDTLFEKLDRLSGPLGSLLDAALNRLAPHTTASACGWGALCATGCSSTCQTGRVLYKIWANSAIDCTHGNYRVTCFHGCIC